ncbi:splicing factor 3B subunit 1-like [Dorcoceras hygrometricum]|uniref:Splicing factor 3B subunit 1-like n=1 Tax=Dorcoceras hygrometricum TaxID=472368 RepID=A0A2Z7B1F1_9LAMI|nr:splicing factor 3B subunit 1-like [Dorcoceras hygrometricum]
MMTRSEKRPNRKNDRKVLVAEESNKNWADSDSYSTSSSSSSSDSEPEEVHCFMENQTTTEDEVLDFSNSKFTREDLMNALNELVHEYRKLSQAFEEIKAENNGLKNSIVESSNAQLEDTDSLKTELKMASALINNASQIYFDSVFEMEDEGTVKMFKALESSGLRGFLGCSSAIYEAALVELFQNDSVRDGKFVSTIQGKAVEISEELFAGTFELPTEGLTEMSDVPKDLVFDARTVFSFDAAENLLQKEGMKFEFRLLNDTLAKTVMVKAGSFDAVTHEHFLMMSAIHSGVKINWGRLLFDIFKDMGAPDLELEKSKDFPPLKILTAKAVGTYVAKNKNITVDVDEPAGDDPVVKKKAASKRKAATTVGESVAKKKRTTVGKEDPSDKNLDLVTVAQDVEPISTVPAVTPRAPRLRAPKRKLIISETEQMETDLEEPEITRSAEIDIEGYEHSIAVNDEDDNLDGAENEIARKMASFIASKQFLKEPLRSGENDNMSGFKQPSKIIETEEETEKETDVVEPVVVKITESMAIATERRIDIPAITTYHEEHVVRKTEEKEADKQKEIEPVATEEMSLEKCTDSEDTEPLSKVLALAVKYMSDESGKRSWSNYRPSNTNTRSICWSRHLIKINGLWTPIEEPDRWYCMCRPSCFRKNNLVSQRGYVSILAPICVFIEPVQDLGFPPPMVKTWGCFRVCTDILQFNLFGRLQPVGTTNHCTAIVPMGSVVDRTGIPKRSVNNVQYSLPIVDSISIPSSDTVAVETVVDTEADSTVSLDTSQRSLDSDLVSPSSYSDSPMCFTTYDIPLGDETTAVLPPDLT